MGALRTYIAALAALTATHAVALPNSPEDRARAFADCAGRYSAVAEHARLFDGDAAEEAEAHRNLFITLLEATLPDIDTSTRTSLNWRIDSKAAHAALLSTAAFTLDAKRAQFARDAAKRHIAVCSALILPV
ncbi:MAG: hypothetical protein AAGK37_18280 [Pseudomonadota bacterium]